jgi:pimeloyl-ACP methyl ester carboxylesterase
MTAGAGRGEPLGVTAPPSGGIDLALPGSGVRLGATRWAGQGPPIVLLHGLASQRRFWNLVVPHLVGLPVLAVDQRGHGDSDRPKDGYQPSACAADLAPALDALGWSRAVLVGHSWGATVAATFAAEHPERTLALVTIDGGFTSPSDVAGDRTTVRRQLEPPRIALEPEAIESMLREHAPGGRWSAEMAAAVLPIFAVGPDGIARARLTFDDHMAIVDTLLDHDPAAVLARVRCPTWLVSCEGGGGEWAAAKAAALARVRDALPRARSFRWADAVHDVPLQWPALVAGLVRSAAEDAATGDPAES